MKTRDISPENMMILDTLKKICETTKQSTFQDASMLTKKFLAVNVSSKDSLSMLYSMVSEDIDTFTNKSKSGIHVYLSPTTSCKFTGEFYANLFKTADISKVGNVAAYNRYIDSKKDVLNGCCEWEKVAAFYLTALKDKGIICQFSAVCPHISDTESREIYSSSDLTKEELIDGVGRVIASLSFPLLETEDAQGVLEEDNINTVSREPSKDNASSGRVLKSQTYKNKPLVPWNFNSKKKIRECVYVKAYKEATKLRNNYPSGLVVKDLVSSLLLSDDEWSECIRSHKIMKKINSPRTHKELKDLMNDGEKTTDDWNELLSYFDHTPIDKLITSSEYTEFLQKCKSAISADEFSKWTDRGSLKKFLTIHTDNWEERWASNWNLSESLKNQIKQIIKTDRSNTSFAEQLFIM